MTLLIGTTLICLVVLWFVVLLIGGRNPETPWWAKDWLVADVQIPSMMLAAIIGIWFMTRFSTGHGVGVAAGAADVVAAVGVVAATGLIIRQMHVGRRLKQFAEMEADDPPEAALLADGARMIYLHRKMPWQVRLYLADDRGYDLAWIRTLRCTVRDMQGRPGRLQLLAFDPDQASARGVVVDGYDTLAAHPELVVFSGTYTANGRDVTIDIEPPRRAA